MFSIHVAITIETIYSIFIFLKNTILKGLETIFWWCPLTEMYWTPPQYSSHTDFLYLIIGIGRLFIKNIAKSYS